MDKILSTFQVNAKNSLDVCFYERYWIDKDIHIVANQMPSIGRINKKIYVIENQSNKKFKIMHEDFLFLRIIPKMEMNIQFENPVPFLA